MPLKEMIGQFFERIGTVIRSFNFRSDLLDILFVSLLIYGFIRLIRQTRSVQLLKGLFWLLVAYGVVKLLNMRASLFLFDQAFKNLLIFVVVLFQQEIRNLFESVGRSNVGSIKALAQTNRAAQERKDMERAIRQVCRAFGEFSQDHTGALVVFERRSKLGDILKTGTTLQARVSKQLIGNIFYEGAPLHDGAAIIRKGQLEAAACILPLSRENQLDASLGTRHRAALGLSEQSDAMVAVVSEETGLISLAYMGELHRGLEPETLEQQLGAGLLTQDDTTKRWWNKVLKHKEGGKS